MLTSQPTPLSMSLFLWFKFSLFFHLCKNNEHNASFPALDSRFANRLHMSTCPLPNALVRLAIHGAHDSQRPSKKTHIFKMRMLSPENLSEPPCVIQLSRGTTTLEVSSSPNTNSRLLVIMPKGRAGIHREVPSTKPTVSVNRLQWFKFIIA